ncbi:MAG TPA: pseudouridine-5'-phosphate glycosidase [Vicinamibacterales bacterium]|nr:pseudouridine-5'-phosphate glycosidase [Vicinamibacterales bacterium]
MPVTNDPLRVLSEEVATAIAAGGPMVALETTVITHGLPPPSGVDTARVLEDDVRRAGATPVTIGILDGAIRLGMTRVELERLATAPRVSKVNPGNLAVVLASRQPGSTTVAATMFAAHASGIRVFATGGIGGVHRGDAGDVSADLTALSRLPIAVVSAGAKAILDLPRTVEMLETLGVPVLGLRTDDFPAFYRRSSGLPVDGRFESMAGLAEAVWMHFALASTTAVLVANPIPETDELPREIYESALCDALAGAEAQRLRGRAVTPFLLDRLHALTGGASVKANVALLRHNARVAGELAVALHAIEHQNDPR